MISAIWNGIGLMTRKGCCRLGQDAGLRAARADRCDPLANNGLLALACSGKPRDARADKTLDVARRSHLCSENRLYSFMDFSDGFLNEQGVMPPPRAGASSGLI